jgi:hypothetical protein
VKSWKLLRPNFCTRFRHNIPFWPVLNSVRTPEKQLCKYRFYGIGGYILKETGCLLECDHLSATKLVAPRKNVLPKSWEVARPPKHLSIYIRIHGVALQKTVLHSHRRTILESYRFIVYGKSTQRLCSSNFRPATCLG